MNPVLVLTTMMFLGCAPTLLAQPSQNTNLTDPLTNKPAEARFSPDGRQVITTSPDKNVRTWDFATGKRLSGPLNHLGTWQLVSFKYGEQDKWSQVPEGQRRLKLITETHFTWVAYEAAGGKVQSMAGGTYTLRDGAYTESLECAGEGMEEYVGKKQSFTLRVEGDKLHQSGQLSDGIKIEEVWQRVK